jgi:hypothetical protein
MEVVNAREADLTENPPSGQGEPVVRHGARPGGSYHVGTGRIAQEAC